MAIQTVDQWIFPDLPNGLAGVPTTSNLLLDAADEKAAFVFRVPKTGTISAIRWRTNAVTTGATVDVRLETVDLATGNPSGTLFGVNSNGSHVLADTNDNASLRTTLTAGASVTRGGLVAVVIVNPSVGFGNFNVSRMGGTAYDFPFNDHFTTAWVKQQNAPVVALEYSDGSYAFTPGCWPGDFFISSNVNTGTTPDEVGNRFSLPFSVRVSGIYCLVDIDGDADFRLYDSDGSTVLASVSADADVRATVTPGVLYYRFSSSVTLNKDTVYRLAMLPTVATPSCRVVYFTVTNAEVMDAFAGGQSTHWTERTDAGAWTDVTTQRAFIGLLIDGLDDGAGGGGGSSLFVNRVRKYFSPGIARPTRRALFQTVNAQPMPGRTRVRHHPVYTPRRRPLPAALLAPVNQIQTVLVTSPRKVR